jgi:NADPH:quinone reductase-like Zn-dependent oxidoreductase
MPAVVVDRSGPPEVLQIRQLPIQHPESGQVLIRVRCSG